MIAFRTLDWLARTPRGPLREKIEAQLASLMMQTPPSIYARGRGEGDPVEGAMRGERGWVATHEIARRAGLPANSTYMRLYRADWAERRILDDPTLPGGRRVEWRVRP